MFHRDQEYAVRLADHLEVIRRATLSLGTQDLAGDGNAVRLAL